MIEERISQYLQAGGLFNPEMMEHDKVRDLIIECRAELTRLRAENESLKKARDNYKQLGIGIAKHADYSPWIYPPFDAEKLPKRGDLISFRNIESTRHYSVFVGSVEVNGLWLSLSSDLEGVYFVLISSILRFKIIERAK